MDDVAFHHRSGRNGPSAQALAVLALVAMNAESTAQAGPLPERGTSAEQDACTPEAFRICVDDIPDEDAIVACLRRNAGRLRPDCQRAVAPESLAPLSAR